MSDFKVDFVIVGQAKSGTTALATFLDRHPSVCMSVPKEPTYFATDIIAEADRFSGGASKRLRVRTAQQYAELFDSEDRQKLGDASTAYIYSKDAAKNIHNHNENAKIIIMLRNPINFLHSLHMQYLNERIEDELDFATALDLEAERKIGKSLPEDTLAPSLLFYSERVKYADQIERYKKLFAKENILVMTHEEFMKDNEAKFAEILEFLDLDSGFKTKFGTVHGSKKPKNKFIHKLVHLSPLKSSAYSLLGPRRYTKLQKNIEKLIFQRQQREPLDPELKDQLTKEYKEEVEKVSKLLGRDLSKEWGFE